MEYSNYSFNEFHNLNRGEYKQLVTSNPKLKNQYFRYLFKNWDNSEIQTFLDVFCETNIIISHLKTQKISNEDQPYVYRFILNSIEAIDKMNHMYLKLIEENFYFIIGGDDLVKCYFSLAGLKDKKVMIHNVNKREEINNVWDISPVTLNLKEINDVYQRIQEYSGKEKTLRLDLENSELIRNLFSMKYREFISVIALLSYRTKEKDDDKLRLKIIPFFGSEVIIDTN